MSRTLCMCGACCDVWVWTDPGLDDKQRSAPTKECRGPVIVVAVDPKDVIAPAHACDEHREEVAADARSRGFEAA
jgi:hypothetical protein